MEPDMKTNETTISWMKWLILALAFTSYLMGFIVRFAWAPLIPVASPELGIDMTRAGLYMSAFYIGYVLTHIPAGLLADRFGVRYILVAAMLLEGFSSIGMAFIGSFGPGFMIRIVTGLGAGTVYAAAVRSVATWFGPRERGIAFGVLMLSPTAGVLVSNQVASLVMHYSSWRSVFIVVGCWAIVQAVILFFLMKDTGERTEGQSFISGLRFITGNRNIMRMAFAGFCLMWVQIGFISWGNTAIKNVGFTIEKAGFIMTLFGVGGILGPLVSGYLADLFNDKKWLLMFGVFLLIPLVLLFGNSTSFAALTALACALGFVNGYINTFLPLMVSEYSGPQWAATANGVTGCIFQMGAIVGPAVIGLSIDITNSFQSVWWLLAAGPVVGIAFLMTIKKTQPAVYSESLT